MTIQAATPATRMPSTLVVLVLSMLLGLQPVATDLYLPSLPTIRLELGAGMPQMQLTLTALLLAFGLSQLVWGPLSDRYGRRPILLIGLAVFVLSSVGSAFSASIEQLIGWRMLQGVAMGAGVMCARAIVRDLYAPVDGARIMSKGLTGLGVIAAFSAPVGGLLAQYIGWRAALAALAVFSAVTLALIALRFEETAPHKGRAVSAKTLIGNGSLILRNRTFWAYAMLATMSYGGLFTFLAASSFVFIQVLGHTKTEYALFMTSMTLAYISGTFICRRLLVRFGVQKTVAIAGVCSLTAGSAMGLLALAGIQNAWAIMVPFWLFMVGHGVHQPCGQSGAVGPFPQAAGTASALSGFLMMVAAFGMGLWLGHSLAGIAAGQGSVLPMTNGIWFWSVLIATTAWTLVRQHGGPAKPAALHEPGVDAAPVASTESTRH